MTLWLVTACDYWPPTLRSNGCRPLGNHFGHKEVFSAATATVVTKMVARSANTEDLFTTTSNHFPTCLQLPLFCGSKQYCDWGINTRGNPCVSSIS